MLYLGVRVLAVSFALGLWAIVFWHWRVDPMQTVVLCIDIIIVCWLQMLSFMSVVEIVEVIEKLPQLEDCIDVMKEEIAQRLHR